MMMTFPDRAACSDIFLARRLTILFHFRSLAEHAQVSPSKVPHLPFLNHLFSPLIVSFPQSVLQ